MCSSYKTAACGGGCKVNCILPVLWLVVAEDKKITFYEKKSGEKIKPTRFSCCSCSSNSYDSESVAKYLEVARALGEFDKIVLVGKKQKMQEIRNQLTDVTNNCIVAEIPEILPEGQTEKNELLNKLMQF